MVRVLVTLEPRMYRQAVALSVQRGRAGLVEVRIAPPEAMEEELASFRPHLLVHNDNDGLAGEVLAGVMCRVTVLYTDGMDAQVSADGRVSEARDMSTEDLLRVVDMARAMQDR